MKSTNNAVSVRPEIYRPAQRMAHCLYALGFGLLLVLPLALEALGPPGKPGGRTDGSILVVDATPPNGYVGWKPERRVKRVGDGP